MHLLIVVGVVSSCSLAAACQSSSDPDRLISQIIEAQKQSPLSDDVLRLMLPCPGSKVSAASRLALLNANFSGEQPHLVAAAFEFPPPLSFRDLVAVAQTSVQQKTKEKIVRTRLKIVPRDLEQVEWQGVTPDQTRFISDHVVLQAREAELSTLMSYQNDDGRSIIFRFRLMPMTLTTPQSVKALAKYERCAYFTQEIFIVDPNLWAAALTWGMPMKNLSFFARNENTKVVDVFTAFERARLADSIAADFVIANSSKFSLCARDVEFLAKSSLSSVQIEAVLTSLKHAALQVAPLTVAALKSKGVSDSAVFAQTRETGTILPPPDVRAPEWSDPLAKLAPLRGYSGNQGLGKAWSNGIGAGAYRVGGEVSAPVLISKTEPTYSDEAFKAKYSGTVLLSLVVDANGLPRDIKVVRPLGMGLDEKAIEAVQKWRFRAGVKDGHSVATQATIEVSFRLLDKPSLPQNISALNPPPTSAQVPRVQVVQVSWHSTEFGAMGFGKANLLEGSVEAGLDFTFSCSRPFLPSDGPNYYPAHWKKPGTRLVIETSEIGNPKKHSNCELKVAVQPYTFRMQNGQLFTEARR